MDHPQLIFQLSVFLPQLVVLQFQLIASILLYDAPQLFKVAACLVQAVLVTVHNLLKLHQLFRRDLFLLS